MDFSNDENENLNDDERVEYFMSYYEQLLAAVEEGANVKGVFTWFLLDGFEFNLGMEIRFGIHYVDENFDRYERKSAKWFKAMLAEQYNSQFKVIKEFLRLT